jgi:hypothetical protein
MTIVYESSEGTYPKRHLKAALGYSEFSQRTHYRFIPGIW